MWGDGKKENVGGWVRRGAKVQRKVGESKGVIRGSGKGRAGNRGKGKILPASIRRFTVRRIIFIVRPLPRT